MTVEMEMMNGIVREFERAGRHSVGWVNEMRARGMETFERIGFPTTKQEEWRDTNVKVLAEMEFAAAPRPGVEEARELARAYSFGKEAAAELVFVNGVFEAGLSRTTGLPKGVRVMNLAGALEEPEARSQEPEGLLRRHLGKYAKIEEHPFAAINTGFLSEGAVVHVAKGAVSERPIHLLFLSVAGEARNTDGLQSVGFKGAAMTSPRVLVVAEENSECSVVETYAGSGNGFYLTNGVTEIVLGKRARMDHNKLQQEGVGAYHVALQEVRLEEESSFVSHSTSLGSKLTRNDLRVFLGGERAEATLNGLVIAKGEQHIDNHTLL
jgi:Fe-S cluster assembly protein SufD